MFTRNAIVFAAALLLVGGGIAVASLRGEPPRRVTEKLAQDASRRVTAPELARWIIEGRRDFAVVDLRGQEAFGKEHVRDAVSCGSCHESKEQGAQAQQGDTFVDLTKKLVLYTQSGTEPVTLPRMIAANPRLHLLAGGYDAWKAQVLAPVAFGGETDEDQLDAKKRTEAVRAFFSGEAPAASQPARLPVAPVRRTGAHRPAAAREGC